MALGDDGHQPVVVEFYGAEKDLARDRIGGLSAENAAHFVRSLAAAARAAIHLDVIRGENDHHRVEAAFKALALALRQALSRDGAGGAPSTKGVLG